MGDTLVGRDLGVLNRGAHWSVVSKACTRTCTCCGSIVSLEDHALGHMHHGAHWPVVFRRTLTRVCVVVGRRKKKREHPPLASGTALL